MIKQRSVTYKTAGATLTYSEFGDVVVNSASANEQILPTPSPGLWYRISNVGAGLVTISYNSSTITTLKQTEQALLLANATSAWWMSKGSGAMTKAEIEAVLTGELTSHSHAVNYTLPQAIETVLGGIKAKAKTTESNEVVIDTTTGKLYATAADAAENGIPEGGSEGQILSKIDSVDFNAEWVTAEITSLKKTGESALDGAIELVEGNNITLTQDTENKKITIASGGSGVLFGCKAYVVFDGITNNNVAATYSQSGTTVTITSVGHGHIAGHKVKVDITSGTGVDGVYTITGATDDAFTYTAGTSLTTSGNVTLIRCTIKASGNVHSVSRGTNAEGEYQINFAEALDTVDYAFFGMGCEPSGGTANSSVCAVDLTDITATRLGISTEDLDGGYVNLPRISISIFE